MRAQASLEMASLIAFMFFIFVVFVGLLTNNMAEAAEKRDQQLITDMGDVLKNEVVLASVVEDGYYREFDIPYKLYGRNFSVEILSAGVNELVLEYVNHTFKYEYVASLPKNVTGNFIKGKNIIKKQRGVIYIN